MQYRTAAFSSTKKRDFMASKGGCPRLRTTPFLSPAKKIGKSRPSSSSLSLPAKTTPASTRLFAGPPPITSTVSSAFSTPALVPPAFFPRFPPAGRRYDRRWVDGGVSAVAARSWSISGARSISGAVRNGRVLVEATSTCPRGIYVRVSVNISTYTHIHEYVCTHTYMYVYMPDI